LVRSPPRYRTVERMHYFDRATSRLPQPWRTIVDWAMTIAVAITFVLVFEAEVAKPYRIPSASMEPTLHCAKPGAGCLGSHDDRIIANRLAYRFASPQRGQMVVFTTPPAAAICGRGDGGSTFVKRLTGTPGDTVSERNGYIFINGKPLREPYVDPALRDHESGAWPRIAPGHYFFLGDDRANSCDSRRWGTVPRTDLIGPAILTYRPPSRWGWH
jgi:signal peptidase I